MAENGWDEAKEDEALLRAVDDRIGEAVRRAGSCLDHRRGCPRCCIGPFPINILDARRLARGLIELDRADPADATVVRGRSPAQLEMLLPHFPGDPVTGILTADEEAEGAFCGRFSKLPCSRSIR